MGWMKSVSKKPGPVHINTSQVWPYTVWVSNVTIESVVGKLGSVDEVLLHVTRVSFEGKKLNYVNTNILQVVRMTLVIPNSHTLQKPYQRLNNSECVFDITPGNDNICIWWWQPHIYNSNTRHEIYTGKKKTHSWQARCNLGQIVMTSFQKQPHTLLDIRSFRFSSPSCTEHTSRIRSYKTRSTRDRSTTQGL